MRTAALPAFDRLPLLVGRDLFMVAADRALDRDAFRNRWSGRDRHIDGLGAVNAAALQAAQRTVLVLYQGMARTAAHRALHGRGRWCGRRCSRSSFLDNGRRRRLGRRFGRNWHRSGFLGQSSNRWAMRKGELRGYTKFALAHKRYLPLLEAKLFHQYDHRYNSFEEVPRDFCFGVKALTLPFPEEKKADPAASPLSRYWVSEVDVMERWPHPESGFSLAFRGIINVSTNRRAFVCTALPVAGGGIRLHFL